MNLAVAFGAGILSFLSPCVLPLVPAYLVNLAGESALGGADRRRTMSHALVFVLGFSAVFTLLWVGIALLGGLVGDFVTWMQRIAGALLIVLGTHMLGLITIPFLDRPSDVRLGEGTRGYTRSLLIGVAF
ncbi:MAG TPA: cytochrome c biogenesis protein CcdA, partial [Candidatus Limnocylindria bacterium]